MMEKYKTIPQRELLQMMKRFFANPKRGISKKLFSDLCGVSVTQLRGVFEDEELPMTIWVQKRVSKAYQEFKNGEVGVYMNRDHTRFVQYRKEAVPPLKKGNRIELVNGKIQLKIGIINRNDYSQQTLDEQLKGEKNGSII
jgi:AraC-like DNA-binding protein